jgi:hypothetical protein
MMSAAAHGSKKKREKKQAAASASYKKKQERTKASATSGVPAPGGRPRPVFQPLEDEGLEGWMTKKGGVRPNWLKRWFVLSETSLEYFDVVQPGANEKPAAGAAGRAKPLGTIELSDVTIARFSEAPNATHQEIEVCTGARIYRFQVSNPRGPTKKQWVDTINEFREKAAKA